jgi:NAD(P)-dependent dehydrogenase (short-subunit alcohol dehydrogenase family)
MMREYNTNTTADDLLKDLSGEIKGKVILITGVTTGTLGGHFVESIAKAQPAGLILAGRSAEKTEKTANTLKAAHPNIHIHTVQLNLSSLAAVREAANAVNSWEDIPYIDVLVNNAGLMAVDYALTVDGYETQFASNHLGHFLFTNLLMDKLLASKSPRVVNVSSDGHRLNPIRWADYNFSVCLALSLSTVHHTISVFLLTHRTLERRDIQQVASIRPIENGQYAICTVTSREARQAWLDSFQSASRRH